MAKDKRSFFERLTGTVRMDEEMEESYPQGMTVSKLPKKQVGVAGDTSWEEESEKDAELTVDVYQTPDMIIVKAMIAGVRPDDLDVTIARDTVTIRGTREEERVENDGDYHIRELFWGSFSRTIPLPEEIDVDESEAVEKHGLLILKLPKLDRRKESKLKVKTV